MVDAAIEADVYRRDLGVGSNALFHVNPLQSANPRPIQNTAETVRPPDWHGLADWIFKKGEYFTPLIIIHVFFAKENVQIGQMMIR